MTADKVDIDELPDIIGDDEQKASKPRKRSPARPRSSGTRGGSVSRILVRRIANKVDEITRAPERHREILSSILGVNSDPVDITTAIFTADKPVTTPVADLLAVSQSDPIDAGLAVVELGKGRIKNVWTLAVALGIVTDTVPASDTKAASALARAALGLSDEQRAELNAVVELSRPV